MNNYCEGDKTFIAGENLERARRVKKSGNTVVYADAGEPSIGVTTRKAASGAAVSVKTWNNSGTFLIEAAAAVTANAAVYGANDGKIDDAVSGSQLGTANEAAAEAGNLIEVLTVKAPAATIADAADAAAITYTAPDGGATTDAEARAALALLAADHAATRTALTNLIAKFNAQLAAAEKAGVQLDA